MTRREMEPVDGDQRWSLSTAKLRDEMERSREGGFWVENDFG
jgi:hypothetical protein